MQACIDALSALARRTNVHVELARRHLEHAKYVAPLARRACNAPLAHVPQWHAQDRVGIAGGGAIARKQDIRMEG